MKKLLKHALSVNNLRKEFGYQTLWEAAKSQLNLEILDSPQKNYNAKNILVLSPHPDDDVFCCGGCLAKYAQNKANITIVYLCDGSRGTVSGKRDISLIATRQNEAKGAAKLLNIHDLIFLDFQDDQLKATDAVVDKIATIIQDKKIDLVYLPILLDTHPDHAETAKIFYLSLKKLSKSSSCKLPLVASYEIWSPVFPNRIIDITDVIDLKKKAILAHQSQLKSRHYDKAMLALNKYRASINSIDGYAEAFFICPAKIYIKLFQSTKL